MSRPTLFDVLTMGVFWRMDQRAAEMHSHERARAEELELKRREVEALERLARTQDKSSS